MVLFVLAAVRRWKRLGVSIYGGFLNKHQTCGKSRTGDKLPLKANEKLLISPIVVYNG